MKRCYQCGEVIEYEMLVLDTGKHKLYFCTEECISEYLSSHIHLEKVDNSVNTEPEYFN